MPDKGPPKKKPGPLRRRLANPEVRDRIFRIFSITLILIVVGASAVLILAYVMELEALVVAFSGVLTMALAFYLFMRLWPDRPEPSSGVGQKVSDALKGPEPQPLSPEEYRKQRKLAQNLIRDKAAPALAKAIRGLLKADEMKNRKER
ncbi:MAG TPA: hypothetical protein DIU35_14510 [Candidatus Latescibacteria bacterium]|nr:hypothetical protein [Gemmatimonadota bacterium]HCR18688.1 hypothetical protein [Candidatus Latescibacterota bacterium]|tara:strand:- start:527 stop:970 length:444 start_codon:yes stop_codon:yes gene_type:complete